MLPIQKYTHSLVFISLWTLRVPGKELFCPGIPDWRNKSCEERVDYTQYDLVREGFFVASAGNFLFETKGKHDAHILLQNEPEVYSRNVYEVVLGSDLNRMSVLRSSCHGPCIDDLETPGILNETEYRSFWITWNTSLAIGQGTKIDISNIILFTRMDFPIKSMRISYGWGSDGFFRFHDKYRGTTISRKDEDKPSVLTVALATSTGFCFVILLSTILWVCYLWNKRKSTGMETHSQPNPVGGEHYEGLRGREQESVYQNEEQYASVSV
ncbi:uncharacterized protein LOC128205947 isoform X2 [Mya arenaria]|uniref:uncharacterized protein LOC128205947 isoform X2 n=1 Tax=Mya arenaria TaxID=6604 RepID=UPI0022E4084A|nr:uncharacterized protein LOC128205947 isoform X2 [Mya arenaria]